MPRSHRCLRRATLPGLAATCSKKRKRPPGFKTRRTSASVRAGSGTEQSTSVPHDGVDARVPHRQPLDAHALDVSLEPVLTSASRQGRVHVGVGLDAHPADPTRKVGEVDAGPRTQLQHGARQTCEQSLPPRASPGLVPGHHAVVEFRHDPRTDAESGNGGQAARHPVSVARNGSVRGSRASSRSFSWGPWGCRAALARQVGISRFSGCGRRTGPGRGSGRGC